MDTLTIRQYLHKYVDTADDRKLEALFVMVEDEIQEFLTDYTPELKTELDRRITHYLNGGEMISPEVMNEKIRILREGRA